MRTYRNLYEEYLSDLNIFESVHDARLGKKHHELLSKMENDFLNWLPVIKRWTTNFKNSKHTPRIIHEGSRNKQREIIVPTDKEQVIHHMLVNPLKPVVLHGMYEHAYGSVPGKGAEKCAHYIKRDIKHDRKNTKYCLKMDIRHYYPTIDTSILKAMLSERIKDDRYLAVLFEVIDVYPVGLPLGFYTSQWLAQFYLHKLDRFIKQDLKAVHYYRYVDDMVIFGSNKRELHRMRIAIEQYLNEVLHLEMKGNWQVFRFDWIDKRGKHHGRDLDFLGYRFFRDKTILRKSIMIRCARKAKRIHDRHRLTVKDARTMMAYLGKIDHADVYGMYKNRIKPYANIKRCKRKISAHDRREKRLCGLKQNQTLNLQSRTQCHPRSTTTTGGTSNSQNENSKTAQK